MNKSLQHSFKYISVYLSASLDIDSSIELVCRRLKGRKIIDVFREIQRQVRSGKSLRDSFSILRSRRLLDSVSWSILYSSEYGGNISESFASIAKYMEHRSKTKNSLIGALAYPAGMLFASFCMIVFLITFAFPKITPLFVSMNAPIPPTTKFILSISDLISNWGLYMGVIFVSLASTLLGMYVKNKEFRRMLQSGLLKTPLLSRILLFREYANIASSIGILLKNNKTFSESMRTAMDSSPWLPVRHELESMHADIESGQKISTVFEKSTLFRGEWVDLISVGEMTGSLPRTFSDISSLYENRYEDAVQVLIRSSEPLALLCTAAVVLLIALSVISPMYSIIGQVQGQ